MEAHEAITILKLVGNWQDETLAKHLDCSWGKVVLWENGKITPPEPIVAELVNMAEVLIEGV